VSVRWSPVLAGIDGGTGGGAERELAVFERRRVVDGALDEDVREEDIFTEIEFNLNSPVLISAVFSR
jgi:hypothetical protein